MSHMPKNHIVFRHVKDPNLFFFFFLKPAHLVENII